MRIANILKGVEEFDYLCVHKNILEVYLKAIKSDEPELMKFKHDLLSTKGTSNVVPFPEGMLSRLVQDKVLLPYSKSKSTNRSIPLVWGVVEIHDDIDDITRKESPIALLVGSTNTIAVPWFHISSKEIDRYGDYYHMDKMMAMGFCRGVYTKDSISRYKWDQFTRDAVGPYAIPYMIDGFTGGGTTMSPTKWIRYSTNPFALDIFVPMKLDCTNLDAFMEINLYRNTIIKYSKEELMVPFFKYGRKVDEYDPKLVGNMLIGQDSEVLDVIWENKSKMMNF